MLPIELLEHNKKADEFSRSHLLAALDMNNRLKAFGMTSFIYNRIVDDNKYMVISSQHTPFRNQFGYTADKIFFDIQLESLSEDKKFSLWQCSFNDVPYMDFFRCRNINHGIGLYRNHALYKESFHFASTNDNPQILDFYLNNLDLLNSLADDFLTRMGNLLDPASEKLIYVAGSETVLLSIHLTQKERLCLRFLEKGYTNKEIAQHFGNSPRTIEEHVANIMKKYKVDSRQAFINIGKRGIQLL